MSIKHLLQSPPIGTNITIKGWVRTFRSNRFIAINDGSTIANLQCVVDFEKEDENELKRITTGSCLSITGQLVESQGKGQTVEIIVNSFEVLGDAPVDDYPLQPKKHSLEFLREIAHLRPRTNTFSAVFRVRHALSFAIHNYFNKEGFVNWHSPIITGSDAEGAGEMFRVSTLPAHDPGQQAVRDKRLLLGHRADGQQHLAQGGEGDLRLFRLPVHPVRGAAADALKIPTADLATRVTSLMDERKKLERQLAEAKKQLAMGGGASGAPAGPETINGINFIGRVVEGVGGRDLRGLIDEAKAQMGSGVAAFIGVNDGKAALAVGVTDDLKDRFGAVDLVKAGAGAVGGKGGGGRPDFAQAGGPDGSMADAGLAAIRDVLAG